MGVGSHMSGAGRRLDVACLAVVGNTEKSRKSRLGYSERCVLGKRARLRDAPTRCSSVIGTRDIAIITIISKRMS